MTFFASPAPGEAGRRPGEGSFPVGAVPAAAFPIHKRARGDPPPQAFLIVNPPSTGSATPVT